MPPPPTQHHHCRRVPSWAQTPPSGQAMAPVHAFNIPPGPLDEILVPPPAEPATPSSNPNSTTLATVEVIGGHPAASEGSGSWAAQSTTIGQRTQTLREFPQDAIESEQIEIGLKANPHPHLGLGIALFDIKRDASDLTTANDFVTSEHFQPRGIEFNTTSHIGRNLMLYGNAAFLETTPKNTIAPIPHSDGIGNRPVDAQNSGLLNFSWVHSPPLGAGKFIIPVKHTPKIPQQLMMGVALSLVFLPFANADGNFPDGIVQELDAVRITAPLNKTLEVNAGAFGARDKMEIPLVIENYGSGIVHTTGNRTVADVLTVLDPSVTNASFGGGFDNFRLRGFAGDLFNTLRIDGLALAPHQDMPLELVERVDVLKGPAGFLYGVNSPGGTINYLPKRPTKAPFARVTMQGSSLSARYAALDNSASFADGILGYRLNTGYSKTGDFNHFGDSERKFIGMATDIRLSSTALLQINSNWTDTQSMADPLLRADQSSRTDPLNPATYILPPKINRRHALSPSWFHHGIEASNLDVKLEYTLSEDWTAVGQWNFSRVKHDAAYNDVFDIQPDGNIGYAALAIRRSSRYDSWTGQTYLTGTLETGRLLHEVFVGGSHHMNHDRSPLWDVDESVGSVPVRDVSVGNIHHPVQPPRIHYGATNALDYNSNIQESSVFASDLITFNGQFQAMLGGRYIRFEARNHYADATPERKNIFVPAAALMWRPAQDWMVYISHSRGLERGEYAPYNAVNAAQSTDAIESHQYEIGLKAQFGENSSLGLALFDLQRDASYLNASNYFLSDGQYQHQGIELTGSTRLFQRLSLVGNVAFLGTELKKVDDLTTLGKRSAGAPRWKAAMRAQYLFANGFSVEGTVNHVGSRAVDAQNSGFIPGYTLLGAGVSYAARIAATPVTFCLQGRNLTDKYYYPGTNSGGLQVGRGREIFLSAQMEF